MHNITWPEAFVWVGTLLSIAVAFTPSNINLKFGGRHSEHVHYHDTDDDDDTDDLCSNIPNVPEAERRN